MKRFGIEIEATGRTASEIACKLTSAGIPTTYDGYSHTTRSMWKTVSDASLNAPKSFELVSPPMPLTEDSLNEVKAVCNLLESDPQVKINRSCGLHVHIEATALTPKHIASVIRRYQDNESTIDSWMPQSRRKSNNFYCKSIRSKSIPENPTRYEIANCLGQQGAGRYYKVNPKPYITYGTIEFRQHSGTVNAAKVTNWIRFCGQFVEASRPVETTVEATSVIEELNGRAQEVAREIATQDGTATLESLALALGTTTGAVRVGIWRARKAGMQIACRRGTYTVARRITTAARNIWDGIDNSIREFYNARAAQLATA